MSDEQQIENGSDQVDTECPTCAGNGTISRPKMAIMGGRAMTLLAEQKCPTCSHLPRPGWLPGLQPPV
ncbi:hypothetical protein [Amycolatopsis granulosa]|uniref:hypothetical protein n=1 Tax=Amycolatopsis granulosa TaxID=185684 RepID=UPI001421F2A8|nr:hypothetical protein [Amycolatopsis granulosa]NIH87057.1 putative RNA-binding Zn-ribbon protein involved in translation (DUF1610 family) [Amycolatopsis granulosa]